MTRIHRTPERIPVPELEWTDVNGYKEKCKEHLKNLREYCIDRCVKQGRPTKYVGEEVHFPVADGSASYMVASLKPLELIHIELYDAYSFEYVHKLDAEDIVKRIEIRKGIEKFLPNL
jgi:hypothetical protein